MSFEAVDELKSQYTDKFVEVDPSIPELRRFKGLTGTVKTVNMNGRLLVQFDHPVDISWYDIDPSYLRLVEPKTKAGLKKPAAEPAKPAAGGAAPAAGAVGAVGAVAPAAKAPAVSSAPASGAAAAAGEKPLSKLELARQQGAARAAAALTASTNAPAASGSTTTVSGGTEVPTGPGGRPLSKLELARLQGAAGATKPASATSTATGSPPVTPTAPPPEASAGNVTIPVGPGGKPLSKLELARMQGAAGSQKTGPVPAAEAGAPAAPVATAKPVATEMPVATEKPVAMANPIPAVAPASQTVSETTTRPAIPTTGPDGRPLSKLELARLQGPFKG